MNNCLSPITNFLICINKPEVHVGFWTMFSTLSIILGILGLYAAWSQLRGLFKINNADFNHRFRERFFSQETRDLIFLLDSKLLSFEEGSDETRKADKFIVNIKALDRDLKRIAKISVYTAPEIDDLLLGHFEDIGFFERRGVVDISFVYESFSEYILLCWKNKTIQQYLASLKSYSDTYENFKYISVKCNSYGLAKRSGCWMTLWKIRWFIKNKFSLKLKT